MKKSQKVLIVIVIIGVVGMFAYSIFKSDLQYLLPKEDVTVSERVLANGKMVIEIIDDEVDIEKQFPMDMSEVDIQNSLHKMTHMKVIAEKKWGTLPLTKERITRLIDVTKENEDNFEHFEIYLTMLYRWQDDDFSQIDKEHNQIWKMQDGTIGEATGIMTPEEELEYIETHYDTK